MKPDLYPPPYMEDLSAWLAGMTVFSKLDLRKGYYQVSVAASDVQKTAVITSFGLFEFRSMLFGLQNAGQSFQRFMDQVLEGVPQVFLYMDDVLVASRNHVEHQEDLRRVLQRLEEHGLVLNKEKCTLSVSQADYLGHVVDATGWRLLPARVLAISDFPLPSTKGELQRFLGMVNYYLRFISRAASILKPLTDTTRGPGGRNMPVEWTQKLNSAFKQAKAALSSVAA